MHIAVKEYNPCDSAEVIIDAGKTRGKAVKDSTDKKPIKGVQEELQIVDSDISVSN
jgi:hypothetical protein